MTDTAAERAIAHACSRERPDRQAGTRAAGQRPGRPARDGGASSGPLPAGRSDAVVFAVRDAERAARHYAGALGLRCTAYAGPDTGEPDIVSYVLQGPGSRFVLSSVLGSVLGSGTGPGAGDGGERRRMLAAHLAEHGDGVVDLAVAVPDVHYAYDFAVDRGALSFAEPYELHDRYGTVVLAAIGVPGGTRHTLVDRSGYAGPYLPGYIAL